MTIERNRREAREAREALMEEMKRSHGIKGPAAVRALMAAMWESTHDQSMPREEMLSELALFSGMAMAALHDYAILLDRQNA
jgi:hypothetical protein